MRRVFADTFYFLAVLNRSDPARGKELPNGEWKFCAPDVQPFPESHSFIPIPLSASETDNGMGTKECPVR